MSVFTAAQPEPAAASATPTPGPGPASVETPFVDHTNGRAKVSGVAETDRNLAVLMHLSPLGSFFFPLMIVAPLIIWLVRKDQSSFSDDHGKESLNFLISFVVMHIVLAITIVGMIGIPVLWIVGIINVIRGAVAAGHGELFRYPMTIRFLS